MSVVPTRAAILAQWERVERPLAPLTEGQRDAVVEVGVAVATRPIQEKIISRAKEEQDLKSIGTSSQDGSTTGDSSANQENLFPPLRQLEKGQRIETGQQFLEWLHQVENHLQYEEDAPFRSYIDQLEQHKRECETLLSQVDQGLDHLSKLGEQYNFVSTKSNSLHAACQHLLSEQTQLSNISEQISEKLVYFTEADRIAQKLTSPTMSVVSEGFVETLARIDECLMYINDHSNYKQSGVYRVKYQACLSRALGMIRSHVKTTLSNAVAAASPSAQVKSTQDSAFTLFYGKFRALAPRVSATLHEVEERIGESDSKSPLWQEYESVLSDCHGMYFASRSQLLLPSVRSAVSELSQKHQRDHCGLVRAGCAFLLHICEDEYQLYHQFFGKNSEQLHSFLESLCQVLYDTLRPLIIHLHHLETLSELTGILRFEMLGHHCAAHPPQLESFERVMAQMLQDIQERLVFRAYVYIRTDILGYNPAPGDLAYPEKLEMMESIAESIQLQQQQSQSGLTRKNSTSSMASATSMEVAQINAGNRSQTGNSPADLHGMWYPPVRRTLVCLSKLYRCLERGIFQGLSQEALTACIDSVANAADQISAKKTAIDGRLFEIKHLLILREQIAPFQVDFAVKEMALDFSKLRTAAWSLLSKRGEFLHLSSSNAVLEFLLDGAPEVKEYSRDSRKEVDRRLKAVCERLITESVGTVVAPIKEFLAKVEDHRKTSSPAKLSSLPWAKPDQLQDMVAKCQRQLKRQFPVIQRAMQLYLANKETEFILFRPIRNNVLSTFMSLIQVIRSDYSQDDHIVIGCPSQEQIAVVISALQLAPRTPKGSDSDLTRRSVERQTSAETVTTNGQMGDLNDVKLSVVDEKSNAVEEKLSVVDEKSAEESASDSNTVISSNGDKSPIVQI